MQSTLFVVPAEVLGTPVFGIGWAMLLIAHVTFITLAVRLRTVGFDAEARSILIWGAVGTVAVGWVIPSVLGNSGFPIRGYGVFLLLAILAAGGLLAWRRHRIGASWDTIVSISLWSVLGGIVGARLFYVIEYSADVIVRDAGTQSIVFGATLWNAVNIAGGGLVVYGGLLGGTTVALVMLAYYRLPILRSCDTIIPAVVIAMAIGRVGCLMHGCCYGDICSHGGITFPPLSPAHWAQLERGEVGVGGAVLDFTQRNRVVVLETLPNAPSFGEPIDAPADVMERFISKSNELHAGDTIRSLTWHNHATVDVASPYHVVEIVADVVRQTEIASPPGYTSIMQATVDGIDSARRTVDFPATLNVLPVYPTQLYSAGVLATLGVLLLGISWWIEDRCDNRYDGAVFAAFLILEPPSRFVLEIFRADEGSFLGTGMTVGQNIAIMLFLAGIALLMFLVTSQHKHK